jgi:hypothetical protein
LLFIRITQNPFIFYLKIVISRFFSDIDECKDESFRCPATGQTCHNRMGGYKCRCLLGNSPNRKSECKSRCLYEDISYKTTCVLSRVQDQNHNATIPGTVDVLCCEEIKKSFFTLQSLSGLNLRAVF